MQDRDIDFVLPVEYLYLGPLTAESLDVPRIDVAFELLQRILGRRHILRWLRLIRLVVVKRPSSFQLGSRMCLNKLLPLGQPSGSNDVRC